MTTNPDPLTSIRYRAFVSYSHRDASWASWLHKTLESYRVPGRLVGLTTSCGTIPARLGPIFRDREELPSSHNLNDRVSEALAGSSSLIVICSPHSARSRWVEEEVLAFKRLGRAERIFCLIVAGEPGASTLPGRESEECFCPALRHALAADGSLGEVPEEPIAADARPGKDGRNNAKLKLIAGLLDVGFDRLKQREQQRRLRRMTAVAMLALAMTVVTTTLSIFAVAARAAAERRQKQAETLVNFMLGDLNDKLQQVSRLDIIEAVDDQAMQYFQSLPTTDVTTESLEQRAKALQTIGAVRLDQGKLETAMESFRSALAVAAAVVESTPEDSARQLTYANIWAYVGLTYWYQGKLDAAQRAFESAQAIVKQVLVRSPGDTKAQNQLAQIDNNFGHVLEVRGDLAGAKAQYQAMLGIFRGLAAAEPGNASWQAQLGDANDNLGKVSFQQGQLAEAVAAYRADQRIKEKLSADDPANNDARESLLVSNAILARTLAKCGEDEAALSHVRDAVDSARKLLRFDPTHTYWQEDLGYYSLLLGNLLRQLGHDKEASAANAEAVQMLGALVAKDPGHVRWQKELAQGLLENARMQLKDGNAERAREAASTALESLGKLRAEHADDKSLAVVLAEAEIVSGQVSRKLGDAAPARAHWTRARDLVADAARQGNDPDLLATWATALLLLGDTDAARPIAHRLQAMGYRTVDFVAVAQAGRIDFAVNEEFSRRVAEAMKQ
jgi:eukaryotic-like serine/threonine-protein kinase